MNFCFHPRLIDYHMVKAIFATPIFILKGGIKPVNEMVFHNVKIIKRPVFCILIRDA